MRFVLRTLLTCAGLLSVTTAHGQPVMENLGRGVVVVRSGETTAYVGWRLLGTDPATIGFNLYRTTGTGRPSRLNKVPSGAATAYTYNANDASVGDLDGDGEYEIVLKWDPSNARDTASRGVSGHAMLDAYKLNGR